MSLIQYRNGNNANTINPWRDLLKDDFFSPFFPVTSSQFIPALDVAEDKDNFTIKVDLPGIRKDDVHLSFEDGILSIEGERKEENEQKDKNYHRVERTYGRFIRSFNLGTGVDASKIQANYKDGVLQVVVPKLERAKPKAIDIKVG
jgi:HSP20 family protein